MVANEWLFIPNGLLSIINIYSRWEWHNIDDCTSSDLVGWAAEAAAFVGRGSHHDGILPVALHIG